LLIREAIAQVSNDLKNAGIENPGLDASILLAHLLNTNRSLLLAAGNESLSDKKYSEYNILIDRRCKGECVAVITGKKEFWGLEFTVNRSVLIPRPDTEILVEAALNQLSQTCGLIVNVELRIENKDSLCILDLCTGSGAVAISLKYEMPELEVWATDISDEALEVAKENAERLLHGSEIRFYQSDLYKALAEFSNLHSQFSIITANPPYIPSRDIKTLSAEVQNEPSIALDGGESGLDIITRIIEDAPVYLCSEGALLMEADPRQMDDIAGLLEKRGFNDIIIYKDLSGSNRVIKGTYEK